MNVNVEYITCTDIKRVRLKMSANDCWYKEKDIGRIFCVRDYRHNPQTYWEMADWDGNTRISSFWLMKKHTEVIDFEPLDENLFRIE